MPHRPLLVLTHYSILFIHFVNILYFILRMKLEGQSDWHRPHSTHSLQVWAHVFITEFSDRGEWTEEDGNSMILLDLIY